MLVFHVWGSRGLDETDLRLMDQVSQRHKSRKQGITANECCVAGANDEILILRFKALPNFENHPAQVEDQLEWSKGGAQSVISTNEVL